MCLPETSATSRAKSAVSVAPLVAVDVTPALHVCVCVCHNTRVPLLTQLLRCLISWLPRLYVRCRTGSFVNDEDAVGLRCDTPECSAQIDRREVGNIMVLSLSSSNKAITGPDSILAQKISIKHPEGPRGPSISFDSTTLKALHISHPASLCASTILTNTVTCIWVALARCVYRHRRTPKYRSVSSTRLIGWGSWRERRGCTWTPTWLLAWGSFG